MKKWPLSKGSSPEKVGNEGYWFSEKLAFLFTLKKCEEVASPEINCSEKVATYARRKIFISKKKSQINLAITFNWNYFPEKFPHPEKYALGNLIWILIREAVMKVVFMSCYLHKFLKLHISQGKQLPQFLILTIIIYS